MQRSLVALVLGVGLAVGASSGFAWEGALSGFGASVTIDAGGDVIAAGDGGPVSEIGSVLSLRVVRYAGATGAKLWEQHFTDASPSNSRYFFDPSSSHRMLAQDAGGDLLLAGAGGPAPGTLLKLAGGSGALLWRHDVSGPQPVACFMRSITLDGAGNALAAGEVADGGGACDFTVVKVAGSDGTELWRYTLDGAAQNYDSATAVGMNAAGDVFAAGILVNQLSPTRVDITVVKLAGGNGSELWRQVISGADPNQGTEYVPGPSLVVDPAGDVVVGGGTDCNAGCVFTVTKLAGTNGAQAWQYYLGSRGTVATLAVDGSGDVIAGGDASSVLNTVKLSGATGAELWRASAGQTGAGVYDAVVDAVGDVVVAGGAGSVNTPFFVAKLAATSGLPVWTQTVGLPDASGYAASVAVRGNSIAATGVVQSPAFRNFGVVDFTGGVTGKRLLVRDKAGDASARRLIALSKDPRILAGASGTPPDPTVSGATLTLANPTTGETVALPLPAGNWSAAPLTVPGFQRYSYSDRTLAAGPCNSVALASGKQIKVRCKGSQLGFSLDEPAQGSLDLRLTIGSAFEYCMRFGGTIRHDVPATGAQAGIFEAVDASAPACPNGGP